MDGELGTHACELDDYFANFVMAGGETIYRTVPLETAGGGPGEQGGSLWALRFDVVPISFLFGSLETVTCGTHDNSLGRPYVSVHRCVRARNGAISYTSKTQKDSFIYDRRCCITTESSMVLRAAPCQCLAAAAESAYSIQFCSLLVQTRLPPKTASKRPWLRRTTPRV